MSATIVVGLDIGATKTCALIAQAERVRGEWTPLRPLGIGFAEGRGRSMVLPDLATVADEVQRAVREATLMAGRPVAPVMLGIASGHALSKDSLGVVPVTGRKVEMADVHKAEAMARDLIVRPGDEVLYVLPRRYVLDQTPSVSSPVGMKGSRLEVEVSVFLADGRVARGVRSVAAMVNLPVGGLMHETVALTRLLLDEEEARRGVALVDVGGATTQIAVLADGSIRHLASVECGGEDFTRAVAREFRLPIWEAESLKRRYGAASYLPIDPRREVAVSGLVPGESRVVKVRALAVVLEAAMRDLFRKVREEIATIFPEGPPAGVVLTGGGTLLPGTLDIAHSIFGCRVRRGLPDKGTSSTERGTADPRLLTALALAHHALVQQSVDGRTERFRFSSATRFMRWLRDFF